jgi:hypothetical protein
MDETSDATPADPTCERCGKPKREHYCRYHAENDDWPEDACEPLGGPTFRRRAADMPRLGLAPHPDVPLGRYRHYKGGEYEVIGGALMASDDSDEVFVLYRSIEHGYCAARTVADFTATVGDRRRFERIGEGA